MASDPAAPDPLRPPRPLLTLGRVDQVRVQVGYRATPDRPAAHQFLLDVPVPDSDVREELATDERRLLAALEPVLYAGDGTARHYSLHHHRWHTSWGASPGVLDLGLLVTTGTRPGPVAEAAQEDVVRAFGEVMDLLGRPEASPTSRSAAILRARRSAATAYGLDPDALSVSSEEHRPARNSWRVGLRTTAEDEYDVVVGLVDGYAGSVRVRHESRVEVADSLGSE